MNATSPAEPATFSMEARERPEDKGGSADAERDAKRYAERGDEESPKTTAPLIWRFEAPMETQPELPRTLGDRDGEGVVDERYAGRHDHRREDRRERYSVDQAAAIVGDACVPESVEW